MPNANANTPAISNASLTPTYKEGLEPLNPISNPTVTITTDENGDVQGEQGNDAQAATKEKTNILVPVILFAVAGFALYMGGRS